MGAGRQEISVCRIMQRVLVQCGCRSGLISLLTGIRLGCLTTFSFPCTSCSVIFMLIVFHLVFIINRHLVSAYLYYMSGTIPEKVSVVSLRDPILCFIFSLPCFNSMGSPNSWPRATVFFLRSFTDGKLYIPHLTPSQWKKGSGTPQTKVTSSKVALSLLVCGSSGRKGSPLLFSCLVGWLSFPLHYA